MEHIRLRCQICHTSFNNVFSFKRHVLSHGEKMKEIFPNDTLKPHGYFPFIVFLKNRDDNSNVVGLSHLTLVYGSDSPSCFYLCHVCHLKCPVKPVDLISNHLKSWDHFTNFLSIVDPNSLVFSWMPEKEKKQPYFCVEYMRRNGDLEILQLPTKLLSELKSSLYSDVMHTLSQNEKLFKHLQDALPETVLIQTYQKDSKRESPLLGLHHIVECVCVGPSNERYYLCTLCRLPVAAHMIIKHVLSFDHVFRYFEEWHPSTLLSKASYIKDASFTSMILDLAKQAEEIQGCTHMQHVMLEPNEFKSVNFKSYSQALKKLEVTKKCSLQISIKPGRKLVRQQSTSFSTPPEAQSTPVVQSTRPASFSSIFKICCRVCNMVIPNMFSFRKHLSHTNHQRSVVKVFNNGAKVDGSHLPASFILGIYSYVQRCLRNNEPLVGIPMIVSCVCTEADTEPVYLCFGCLDHFSDSFLEQHLTSEKHLMLTLYQYQDPELLPFAWKPVDFNMAVLKAKVWEKEKARSSFVSMKVVDLPHWIFCNIKTKSYPEAVTMLESYSTSLTDGVPLLETDYDLQAKNNFPLLGKQFLVMYEALNSDLQQCSASLCLLCQRKLHNDESYVHIFSQEHVAIFLDKFHPGSLNSSNVNAKCLLDLAQQAQTRHKTEMIQMVTLTRAVWDAYPYKKTTGIFKDLGEMFEPKIQPKGRLVPSVSPSAVSEDYVRGHSIEKTQNVENKCTKNISSEQKLFLEKEVLETVAEVKKKSEESEEMTKEDTKEVKKTSKEDPGCSLSAVKEDVGVLCKQKEAENNEIIPTQLETCRDKCGRNKRSISMCGGSQDETTSGEDVRHKRQRLASEGESRPENESTDAMEMSPKSHQDERLRTIYDCRSDKHDSLYLCECCSMKIPQKEFISHVTGSGHPNVQLKRVDLEEDVYTRILKESFESVMQMVSVLLTWCDRAPERPSTPTFDPLTLKQEEIQISIPDQHVVDSVRYHIKVENLKTEDYSETSEAAASIPAMTLITTQAPELIEDTKSHVSNFELASTTEENLAPPDLSEKLSEADSTLNSDLESLRTETTLKVDERMSFTVICSATSSLCTATSNEVMEVTSASSAASSLTDLVTMSALSRKTEPASDAKSALQNAEPMSPKASTELHEAPSTMADNTPNYLEPAASGICQTLPKSVATAQKSPPAVKKGNRIEEKVHVLPHIHETTQSAAPQVTAAMPGRPKELPLATANKTKPIDGSVNIGTNQLIVLICSKENRKRRQVYCQLCSVRLQSSNHLCEMNHQYKYVQMKIPGWTANPLEDSKKFQEAVAMLAKEGCSEQRLEVMPDVYEEMNRLPAKIALQRLKEMLKEKSLKDSSSTSNSEAALQKDVVIGSPCEVTSSDDGVNMEKKRGRVKPQFCYPESKSTFSKTPAAFKETHVGSERPRKVPQLQDTQKTPGDAQNTSEVMFLGRDPRVEPAAGNVGQKPSTSSSKEAQAAKHHARPGKKTSSEEMPPISIGVDVEKYCGCVKPQVSCPESTFFKTPATPKETPVNSQQQPRKVPQLQDTRKTPGDAQKTSDVTLGPGPHVEPADYDKQVRGQSRSSPKEDQAAKHHVRPGRKSSSEERPTTSIGVNLENNHGCVKPQAIYPESTSQFSKTPATPKETPVSSQQQLMKVSELQVTWKPPGDAQNTSDVTLSRDPLVESAAGDKEMQSRSRRSYKEDQAAKHHKRPGRKSSSEELSTISIGVDVENNCGCVKPQIDDPESAFSKTPAPPKETQVNSQQRLMKVPESQDTWQTPGDAQNTSDVTLSGDPFVESAAGDKEMQSQSRRSYKEDQAAKHHKRPGRKSSSEELSTISIGVDAGNNRPSVKPQVSYSESSFSKTPATSTETHVSSQQQPRKVPQLKDTQKPRGDARKTSNAMFFAQGPCVEPPDGYKDMQGRSGSSHQNYQATKCHTKPGRKSSSEELSTTSLGVDVENDRGCAKLQVCYPESTTLFKTPATSKDTPVSSQEQPRTVPQLQDAPKTSGDAQKTSEVKFLGRDPRVEPADDKEVQGRSRWSNKEDQAAKHHTRPGRKSSFDELSTISIGQRIDGPSRLSTYLSLKKLDSEVIGQGTVWECQGFSQPPFFLCESCELMLLKNEICQHMISQNHKFNYLQKHHTELLHFWTYQDLTEEEKQEVLDLVTSEVATRERFQKIDAKIVLLGTDLYEDLQNAPFSNALRLVRSIGESELRGTWPPDCPPSQKSQQLESQQSLKPSPPTKTQLHPTPEKDQRCKKEFKQKHLKEATMDGELHEVQKRKASSPLDSRSLHSKPDSVIAPLPRDGTCIHPKKMCTGLAVQEEVVPPVSQHQTETVPVLAANQKDEDSKSPSSRPGNPEVAQTLLLPDPPSKKKPADQSVETLVRSCKSNSLKNSLPPKSTAPPLQPIQEPSSVPASSIAVHPAATPISLPLDLENTKSISVQQNIPPTYFTVLAQIINAMRLGAKKALLAPDNMKAVPSTPSDEGKASVTSECIERNTANRELNPLVTHSDYLTGVAIKSPFENSCVRNDHTLIPESKAASGVVMTTTPTPTASLAESNDPQHPQGSTGQLTCSAVATSVKKPETSDACPINTIVTGRGNYAYGYAFTGGSKGPSPTEVSSDPQAGFSTGLTAPAAYAKYSDATDAKGGHSVYKTPVNPTFTSPANMGVNSLDNTVNSALNPHADGHPLCVSAANTVATSIINSPDSSQSSDHSAVGFYPSHIPSGINYVHLQTIGHSSAVGMEPMWTNVEMQQYQYQQQYQYYRQQQRYLQHQYYRQQQHHQLQQHLLQQQQQKQYSNQQQNQNQQQGWYHQAH